MDIQVLPSADISIHSWSSVYFFSFTALPSAPHSNSQLLSPNISNIHAADTENSRCAWLACCHRWHTNGDNGLLAAAEVNWRAARATEQRAAISIRFGCVWEVRIQRLELGGAWGGNVMMPRRWHSSRFIGTVGRIRTLFATGSRHRQHHDTS